MQDHAGTWLRRQTSHWRDWPLERLLAAWRPAERAGGTVHRARGIAPAVTVKAA